MDNVVILVPAYKPNEEIMLKFINTLLKKFKNIVVVNDGSGEEYNSFFEQIESMQIKVLTHNVNCGKGRAIKTGFEYILRNFPNIIGTITADCDGQHNVFDIEKCANKLMEKPKSLIIGCRSFDGKQVPLRSKFGNKLTKRVFSIFIGIHISDTQSGLRAFGPDLMKRFLSTCGERYEYETNMLIDCKTYDIDIEEVKIETVYIRNNETSHFNPIKDSIKVYKLFFKYIMSSISAFIIDILLFSVFISIIHIKDKIMVATILARTISSLYNFFINSKVVFRKHSRTSIIKYTILVLTQMIISGATVSLISNYLNINATFTKICVDTVIFVLNFIIQREWVFKNKRQNEFKNIDKN